jgi:hypothetical protein
MDGIALCFAEALTVTIMPRLLFDTAPRTEYANAGRPRV